MSFKSFLSADKNIKHFELKDVCKIHTGLSFKSDFYGDNGFPIIKGGNIQDGQITTDNYR
ncbi:type I restriction-modification system, S subunit [Mycoplasma haemofelis Ohio2]|uniref:Type I restriction-modification system, S subunit n=1 Tax=Mycoplasma haemofelis (strain Ohio2) TaxID=859194 RepID=F6FIJ3_MYCHI|nr:type I restriction-modification system, S subunit [Mycoplasma haemofelis Ohio2]